jgi:hypothetical protein
LIILSERIQEKPGNTGGQLASVFSSGADADFGGLLAVSQVICRMRLAEKAPPYCAVFP